MDYIRQSRAAWKLAKRHGISPAAWMAYSSIFHQLNDAYDLTGAVRLTIKEFGLLAGITNHTSIRKARQELLDAGLIVADGIGSGGPGAAGTYRLVDLVATGMNLRGIITVIESKPEPEPEPVIESKPESVQEPESEQVPEPVVVDGSLFPEPKPEPKQEPEKPAEPKPKRRRKPAAKPEPEPKKPYGDYGIVMLSDRQVAILEERYPGLWRQYLSRVESYCYNNKKQKRYEDYCKTIINWIQKDQRNHPDWFQQQNQPEPKPEQKREIGAAVVEAAKQIESQTPDIFAEARAMREAAWQQ